MGEKTTVTNAPDRGFREVGRICGEYLNKGKQVYIEGRFKRALGKIRTESRGLPRKSWQTNADVGAAGGQPSPEKEMALDQDTIPEAGMTTCPFKEKSES